MQISSVAPPAAAQEKPQLPFAVSTTALLAGLHSRLVCSPNAAHEFRPLWTPRWTSMLTAAQALPPVCWTGQMICVAWYRPLFGDGMDACKSVVGFEKTLIIPVDLSLLLHKQQAHSNNSLCNCNSSNCSSFIAIAQGGNLPQDLLFCCKYCKRGCVLLSILTRGINFKDQPASMICFMDSADWDNLRSTCPLASVSWLH